MTLSCSAYDSQQCGPDVQQRGRYPRWTFPRWRSTSPTNLRSVSDRTALRPAAPSTIRSPPFPTSSRPSMEPRSSTRSHPSSCSALSPGVCAMPITVDGVAAINPSVFTSLTATGGVYAPGAGPPMTNPFENLPQPPATGVDLGNGPGGAVRADLPIRGTAGGNRRFPAYSVAGVIPTFAFLVRAGPVPARSATRTLPTRACTAVSTSSPTASAAVASATSPVIPAECFSTIWDRLRSRWAATPR